MLTDSLRDKKYLEEIIKKAGGRITGADYKSDQPEGIPLELIESSVNVVRKTIPIRVQRKDGD